MFIMKYRLIKTMYSAIDFNFNTFFVIAKNYLFILYSISYIKSLFIELNI